MAIAVLFLVGAVAPAAGGVTAGGDAPARLNVDASLDLERCLAGLEVATGVETNASAGAGVDVDLDLECDAGDDWPPGDGTPTPTPSPTPDPTETPTATPNATVTPTETVTDSPTATATDTPTDTPRATPTATPIETPTGTPPGVGGDDGDADARDGSDGSTDAPPVDVVAWRATPGQVAVGEPITVEATLRNRYWARQAATVELVVDGDAVARERVDVPGEGTATITFERAFEASGWHRVGIDGWGTTAVRVVEPTADATAAPATPESTEDRSATATDTPRQETAGVDSGRHLAVAVLVAGLLALAGLRLRHATPRP